MMKGDFSRFTFNEKKHYSGVLKQQGRVQLDADFNEQQAIVEHQIEARTGDIVGPRGVPKANGGFEIRLESGGKDLVITPGNIYVDGILCENNEKDLTFTHQDDYPEAHLPDLPGLYLIYLDVFSRSITAIDDPGIREKALGGADTSVRKKTVWQVKLERIGNVGDNIDCSAFTIGIKSSHGKMTAKVKEVSDTGTLCILPPAAGYRRLENQLYRVEIHKGGSRSQATFKWSRDNGSIEAPIKSISGKTVTLEKMSRDEALGFGNNQWMEIVTDWTELGQWPLDPQAIHPRGIMVRASVVDESKPEITLQDPPVPAISVDRKLHPKLRRWDQDSDDADGIRLDSADPIELEGGIQVSFSEGTYYPGDYWTIPARTAVSGEIGGIEWPTLPQDRHGTYHHYCQLAVVRFDNQIFQGAPKDCRPKFPPLADITAGDVLLDNSICKIPGAKTVQEALNGLCQRDGSKCTLYIWPELNLAEALKTAKDCKDLYVFFHVGTYNLDDPIVIENENIKICGCGPGTKIIASNAETVFHFNGCTSVEVENLHAETGKIGLSENMTYLNGTLTFSACTNVKIKDVSLQCAAGANKASACITVRDSSTYLRDGDEGPVEVVGVGSVRIQDCSLRMGDHQVGILLINVKKAWIEGNTISPHDYTPRITLERMMENKKFRSATISRMIHSARLGKQERALTPTANTVVVSAGEHTISFQTEPKLVGAWNAWIRKSQLKGINSESDLLAHMKRIAEASLVHPDIDELSMFDDWYKSLQSSKAQGSQGIVVGGIYSDEVHILNNSIQEAFQAIHIGLSRRTKDIHNIQAAEDIWICGNSIKLYRWQTDQTLHGIFVGNCDSIIVQDNSIRVNAGAEYPFDGIKIYGHLGKRAIIRQNYIDCGTSPSYGIYFAPLSNLKANPQWVIADNAISNSSYSVMIPSIAVPDAVRKLITIGINYPSSVGK
jgi:hypothetical protein